MGDFCKKYKELIILGIIGIPFLVGVPFVLYPEKDNIIQSELIVILVLITSYYAIQTYRLVEEEKKRRVAEFGQIRIKEFYLPITRKLEALKDLLKNLPFSEHGLAYLDEVREAFDNYDTFRFYNSYFATATLTHDLTGFSFDMETGWIKSEEAKKIESFKKWGIDFIKAINRALLLVNKESREVMIQIRKTYGYYTGEEP